MVAIAAPRAWTRRAFVGSWAAPAGILLVAAVAPFERPLPVALAGFTLTTVELALIGTLALGVVALRRDRAVFDWRTPITIPALAVLACALAASVAAPEFRGNAFKFTGRLAAALLLYTLIANLVTSTRLARLVIATMLGGAAVVGGIAILELAQVPWVLDGLTLFRPGFHVVGGQVRATSTLFYPTITSMYLEVAFALGLAWIASSRLAFAALILTGAGVVATFTRAGLITMAMSIVTYGAILYWKRRDRRSRGQSGWSAEHTRLAALAAGLAALVVVSRSPQMLVARMSTDVSQDWYGAAYDAPPSVTLAPGSFNDIQVSVTNHGRLTWRSSEAPAFALSYHWLSIDNEAVVIYDGLRTPFAQPVPPGGEVRLQARVRAPGYPGTYLLVWDVVQEHRTWLSLEGVYPGRTIATVEGEAVSAPLPTHGRMPSGVLRLPRSVLWQTALRISADRPWLGIGPDNYRHSYGRYLGLAAWDTRVHANNTYLEVLAGMGVFGVAAVAWLIAVAVRTSAARLAAVADPALPLFAAAATACLAVAAHGLVDAFFAFTPTYVAFAIAAGLLYSRALTAEAHAHRL